jgi:hypothetical protein
MGGEIDPLGTRKDALDAFLEARVEEGFQIETHTDVHAIIVQPPSRSALGRSVDAGRLVIEVDEDGVVSSRPAEPRRS